MRRLDAAARKRLGVTGLELVQGTTHSLHEQGIQALHFDLCSHGFRDRLPVRHSLDSLMHQAIGVLDALGIYRSLQLLGHSMGAVIAARIAGILADRLVLLTLMAPLLDHSRPVPVRTTQRTIR